MGNFTNTQYKATIDNLIVGFKERMKNQTFTWFTDKNPTPVTYYKINHEQSMLDGPTGLEYDRLGKKSPLKYNKIENFFIYGIDRMNINLNDTEYGLEADPIDGEGIILPNSIEPTAGDYFSINYLNEKLLFLVTSVTVDTLEDGSNFYQINFKLDQTKINIIDDQVVENYNMIIGNIGTKFKSVIKSSEYKLIAFLEEYSDRMQEYFINLFYDDRVQTFIFYLGDTRLYDPCMIEFIKRNNLFNRERNRYIHIDHQLEMERTFSIEYDCSLYRSMELKNKNLIDRIFATASLIDQVNSTFNCRAEDYYMIKYIRKTNKNLDMETLICINPACIEAIDNNILFNENDPKAIYNLIIKYFNDGTYHSEDFEYLIEQEFQNNIEQFYIIPFYIFIIKDYISKLLANI